MRFHRTQKGLSLQQLADRLEKEFKVPFNPNLLGKVERGTSRILGGDLIRMCSFYQIEIKQFFPKDNKKPVQENVLGDLIESPVIRTILSYLNDHKDEPEFLSYLEVYLRNMTVPTLNLIKGADPKSLKVASPKKKSKKG
ncbi:XRE family transcriptional regulator [Leptospira langatensis]|uniref:XRE family transcriptional regulator n=1 Tax=Leptospira langatensis TaxID=2484983 RepID=A0A5F1ZXR6_9LEPT|nr:XRE family transcriptional regulator [Leptospira langatensis]TGL42431.1 XRE family transcriptional regulator [Leptospira langatensis]